MTSYSTPEKVSSILGLEIGTLAKWRSEGVGPAYIKVGSRVRYSDVDLEAWLVQRRETAGMVS